MPPRPRKSKKHNTNLYSSSHPLPSLLTPFHLFPATSLSLSLSPSRPPSLPLSLLPYPGRLKG
ncbi:hypothetical protein E2C01_093279 [Portunus trituberculatus]|uniref:Uncharacterized protein n=1 Tax=Portunus trituberculatus TaxID=210409 RepID=A0A5B7JU22_PORTR|nr:hypothetical protein [Portunus trituberculatus]